VISASAEAGAFVLCRHSFISQHAASIIELLPFIDYSNPKVVEGTV